jgi:hypothetical protein
VPLALAKLVGQGKTNAILPDQSHALGQFAAIEP